MDDEQDIAGMEAQVLVWKRVLVPLQGNCQRIEMDIRTLEHMIAMRKEKTPTVYKPVGASAVTTPRTTCNQHPEFTLEPENRQHFVPRRTPNTTMKLADLGPKQEESSAKEIFSIPHITLALKELEEKQLAKTATVQGLVKEHLEGIPVWADIQALCEEIVRLENAQEALQKLL